MTRPLERAKTAGSVSRDMAASAAVHLRAAWRRSLRRCQSSPPITSRARTTAKRVRSRVRPAYRIVLDSAPGTSLAYRTVLGSAPGTPLGSATVSVKPGVCLDWRSWRLSQAAMKEANHLVSLE